MGLSYSRMLNNELLNKDSDLVPQKAHLDVLNSIPAIFMDKNDKYTKNTRHNNRIMNFVRKGK